MKLWSELIQIYLRQRADTLLLIDLVLKFSLFSYYGTTTTGILLTELRTLVVLSECVLRIKYVF